MAASTPVWFITASSSGFGKQIAVEALGRGHKVIATARSKDKISDLQSAGADTFSLDVTDSLDNIKSVVAEAHKLYGRLDYLINAAGYILEGAVEEASPQETFDTFNTNVFGTLNVLRAVLPYMRQQGSGVVTTFGSLASHMSGPGFALYSATKVACSLIAEGLIGEVAPFGIKATVVEPGYFRTGFLNAGARIKTKLRLDAYNKTDVGKLRDMLDQIDNNQKGDVVKGCKIIVDTLTQTGAATGKEIPERLVLGPDCIATIRSRSDRTLKLLDDWQDISGSTDLDD